MKYGLEENDITRIVEIFIKFPQVKKAVLYGSRAMGNYKPSSDIDITLVGENLTRGLLSEIGWMLDDLMLPYKVDLSIYDDISQEDLLDHIKRVGISFFESN